MLDVKDKWPEIFLEPFSKNIKAFMRIILEPYYFCSRYIFKNASQITSITDEYIYWIREFYKEKKNPQKILYFSINKKTINIRYHSKQNC